LEVIASARRRIARLAAIRGALYPLLPALMCVVLALAIAPIASALASATGYVADAENVADFRLLLWAGAGLAAAAAAVLAYFEYRSADDFIAAAERVDELVRGRQEVLTLASIADGGEEAARRRSALFPVLMRRAGELLQPFRPEQVLKLDAREALVRSSVAAGVLALAVGASMFGLVRAPSPLEARAERLRELAERLEAPSATAAERALAAAAKEAADALVDPALPPEEKKRRIELVMRTLEEMTGRGERREAEGTGEGEGAGEGAGDRPGGRGSGEGAGPGEGASEDGEESDETRASRIELRNELKDAMAEVETESASREGEKTREGEEDRGGTAPKAGGDPETTARAPERDQDASKRELSSDAQGGEERPEQRSPERSAEERKDSGQGDTKLGEVPAPAEYQRFLKPGEKGARVEIHDARYVMFRLPSEVAAGGGRTVVDSKRPRAATPYTNAPLAETRESAAPDERQLVPPRYRELIR
jgi:hypothetical protein